MYLPSTGKNLKPWKDPQVAMYRPLEAAWGEMMKSEVVVNASLFHNVSCGRASIEFDRIHLPADSVLVDLPVRSSFTVKDIVRMVNVLFEFSGDVPLGVVLLRRRHGGVSTGYDLLCVAEYRLSPPFQFLVFGWRKATDEGTCG